MTTPTVEMLQGRLAWDDVVEVATDEFREFQVRPANGIEYIQFLFFPVGDGFIQLAFGEWHGHFDDVEANSARLDGAIDAARDLIVRRTAVFEELDENGETLVAGLVERDEFPDTLDRRTVQLRRRVFGQPPRIEGIDFSRYYQGEFYWTEHGYRDKMKKRVRDAGCDPSVFD